MAIRSLPGVRVAILEGSSKAKPAPACRRRRRWFTSAAICRARRTRESVGLYHRVPGNWRCWGWPRGCSDGPGRCGELCVTLGALLTGRPECVQWAYHYREWWAILPPSPPGGARGCIGDPATSQG